MIRRADRYDAGFIYDLTSEFNAEYYDRPLNEEKTFATIEKIIADGVCFVSNKGYIGGLLMPDLFRDDVALVEIGWFSKDRSGVELLEAFIADGFDKGADEIRMCTMGTSPPSAAKLLLRRRFELTETSYRLRP